MAVNAANNTVQKHTTDVWKERENAEKAKNSPGGTNPYGQLDKNAFLKLLLAELKYQDPTSPMDTKSMLEQTAMLTSLETQQNTNKLMQNIAAQMQSSSSINGMQALGKLAHIDGRIRKSDDDTNIKFNMHLEQKAKKGIVEIFNSSNEKVREIRLENLAQGLNEFNWDGRDQNGKATPAGDYTAKITYQTEDNKFKVADTTTYPVEAVRFVGGRAQVKIAGQFVDIGLVKEFTQKA